MTPTNHNHDWTPITTEPLNGGPDLAALGESAMTANRTFFVRSHGTMPRIDPAGHRLVVEGDVAQRVEFGLEELKGRFPFVRRAVTVQCGGFRRTELLKVKAIPGELPWSAEAVSTAEWGGVPLAAILAEAKPTPAARHVEFVGHDVCEREGKAFGFAGSVSVAEARNNDVLICWEMNGEPLPIEHGGPLRIVVPNVIGARSVKWVGTIRLRPDASENYFQQRAYKLLAAGASVGEWMAAEPISTVTVNSILCRPAPGDRLVPGLITLSGFAWSGDPGGVRRVEVSIDGGVRWVDASLESPSFGRWQPFRLEVRLESGRHEIVVRAMDASGNSQPADPATLWNAKGYMNNAWQRVGLTL